MYVSNDSFCIQQIADSGQCFRIYQLTDNIWRVIAKGKHVDVQELKKGQHKFLCSDDDFYSTWYDYFDFGTNYGHIKDMILSQNDPYLINAIKFGYGIRILRQDCWEALISFVISQQNNIPNIRKVIKKLCCNSEQFPSADVLKNYSIDELRDLRMGYRAEYIHDIAQRVASGKFDLNALKNLPYSEALKKLMTLHGVGVKVANCVALFGLHHTEAFPIDVWINRIIQKRYSGRFDYSKFGNAAGIIQQYMYFYERSLPVDT